MNYHHRLFFVFFLTTVFTIDFFVCVCIDLTAIHIISFFLQPCYLQIMTGCLPFNLLQFLYFLLTSFAFLNLTRTFHMMLIRRYNRECIWLVLDSTGDKFNISPLRWMFAVFLFFFSSGYFCSFLSCFIYQDKVSFQLKLAVFVCPKKNLKMN